MAHAIPEKIEHLVWIETGFIGDIVLLTAALALAHKTWPQAKQHVITTPSGNAMLAHCAGVTSCIVYDKKVTKRQGPVVDAVKALHLSTNSTFTVQSHRSFRSSLLARRLGFPIVTFKETSFSFGAYARVDRVGALHETRRLAALLEPLGVPREASVGIRPSLKALPLDGEWAHSSVLLGLSSPIIAIAPGSEWGTKRWPIEKFSALAKELIGKFPRASLVLLGRGEEAPLNAAIASACGDSRRVIDLSGKTSLTDLLRIMPHMSLLIGNDSSPQHVASAFNIPVVTMWGSTVSAMGFGAISQRVENVEVLGLDCRPCGLHGPQSCPLGHFRCMNHLSVDAVLGACCRVLENDARFSAEIGKQ